MVQANDLQEAFKNAGFPEGFVEKVLGPEQALQYLELIGEQDVVGLSGDKKQQFNLFNDQLEEGFKNLDTFGLENQIPLGELRFALEAVNNEDQAIEIGNNILKQSGFPGEVARIGKDFAVYNQNTGNYQSINPEGLDPSDLKALQASANDALPTAASLAGLAFGPAGAGAGGIIGGLAAQNVREDLEQKYLPDKENNRAMGLAKAAKDEILLNMFGLGAGRLLARAPGFDTALRAAGAKAGRTIGRQGREALKRAGTGLSEAIDSNIITKGVQQGLNKAQGNTAGALILGVERIADKTIEAGLKAGLSKDEILANIKEELSLLEVNLRQANRILKDEGASFATRSTNFSDDVALTGQDRQNIEGLSNKLDNNLTDAFQKINQHYDETLEAYIIAKEGRDAELQQQLKSRLDKVKEDLVDLDVNTVEYQKRLNLDSADLKANQLSETGDLRKTANLSQAEKSANALSPETNRPADFDDFTQGVDAVGDVDNPGIGRVIQDKTDEAFQSATAQERADFEAARVSAQNEIDPIVTDVSELFDKILNNSDAVIGEGVKEAALKGIPTNASPAQLLEFGQNLNSLIRSRSLSPSEYAILSNVRGRLISDNNSVFSQAAKDSPAINSYLKTSLDRVKKFDALQDKVLNKVVGKNANSTTGEVIRDAVSNKQAFDNFVELKRNDPEVFKRYSEFVGFDDEFIDQAALAQVKEVANKPGKATNKIIQELEADRALKNSPSAKKAIDSLKEFDKLKLSKKSNDIFRQANEKNTIVDQEIKLGREDALSDAARVNEKLDFDTNTKFTESSLKDEKKLLENELKNLETTRASEVADEQKILNELRKQELGQVDNIQKAGLDSIQTGAKTGNFADLKKAEDVLSFSEATPEQKQSLFRQKFLQDPLTQSSPGTKFRDTAKKLKGSQFGDEANPDRFKIFGDDVAPDIRRVDALAKQEQKLADAASLKKEVAGIRAAEDQNVGLFEFVTNMFSKKPSRFLQSLIVSEGGPSVGAAAVGLGRSTRDFSDALFDDTSAQGQVINSQRDPIDLADAPSQEDFSGFLSNIFGKRKRQGGL